MMITKIYTESNSVRTKVSLVCIMQSLDLQDKSFDSSVLTFCIERKFNARQECLLLKMVVTKYKM